MKAWGLVLITLFLWAFIPIIDKLALAEKKISPFAGISVRIAAGILFLIPLLFLSQEIRRGISEMSSRQIILFSASGIISMLISQYFYYQALKQNQVERLFPVLFGGTPVISMILAWLILKETVSGFSIAGAGLIVAGTFLMFI